MRNNSSIHLLIQLVNRLVLRSVITILIFVMTITAMPGIAAAAPDICDEAYLRNIGVATLGCVAEDTCSATSTPGSGANVNLTGNDNVEKTFRFFVANGLNDFQAAGVTGNALAESQVNPLSVSRSGYSGIFQWDKKSRFPNLQRWTQEKGYDPWSLEGQLAFSLYEATERGDIAGMQQQTSLELSAWYWGRFFEGAVIGGSTSRTPLTNVQILKERTDYAREVFNKYGSGQSGTAPESSNTGVTDSTNCPTGTGAGINVDGNFTVYSQYDPAWASLAYGSSTIAKSGCGPAAMAMIITALTGKSITPADTAAYAGSQGMYVPGAGSSWSVAPVVAEKWGLRAEPVGNDLAKITAALKAGGLVVTSGKGAKPFTSGGHYIVIRGITAEGKFKVGDSGHSDTSDKEWDTQPILQNMPGGSAYAIYK